MEWIEVFVATSQMGLEPVEGVLYQCGLNGLMIHDEADFAEFLENPNREWDYVADELVEEKKTKIADVARKAHMSSSYLYKLGEGKRKSPTRNKALQICFGLGLDIDESNELLKLAGVGVLYSKIARDSIIMFCLEKGWGIIECEELLEKYNELSIINEK